MWILSASFSFRSKKLTKIIRWDRRGVEFAWRRKHQKQFEIHLAGNSETKIRTALKIEISDTDVYSTKMAAFLKSTNVSEVVSTTKTAIDMMEDISASETSINLNQTARDTLIGDRKRRACSKVT